MLESKHISLKISIAGIIFGVLAFVLVMIDYFEVQLLCAVIGILLSIYSIWRKQWILGIIGLMIGLLFLSSILFLWIIWPK